MITITNWIILSKLWRINIFHEKFNNKKHKKTEWITKGIMKSIKCKNNLNRQIRSTSPIDPVINTYRTNLRNYNKLLGQSIKNAKKNYYTKCFRNIKSNMKRAWQNIHSVLNKTKAKKQFPDKFKLDAQLLTDRFDIANQFNTAPNKSYKDYLTSPCETFNFTLVTENDINIIIAKLNSKMSSGKDGISNIVLNVIMPVIIKPLITLIINEVLNTGIFPDNLKIAKVVPLYKKGDFGLFTNYRPISLLPSVSKKE